MATITNDKGLYRLLSLPPGLYEITFALDGMNTLVRKDVKISVGQTTTIEAVLQMKSLAESVVVIGQAPTIDLKSTSQATNLDRNFMTAMPAARNLNTYFDMAPGVIAEENNTNGLMSSANGSSVRDNSFNVDGVNMTAPDVGTQLIEFGMDVIDEVSIQTGGLSAEYGDVAGAMVNVVTRSGGNRLSGTASFYYTGQHLQATNTAGTPLAGTISGSKYVIEPGITLGGPLIKGKLWFFTNLSYSKRADNIAGFPYDQATQVPATQVRPYPFLKLTFQPNQADKFTLSYNFSDYRQDNAGATLFNTESSTIRWTQPSHIFNFQWTRMFNSNFYTDFKVGYVNSHINLRDKTGEPATVDMATGLISGGYGVDDLYTATRFQSNLNGTYFVDNLAGSHEFKAGAELQLTGSSRDFVPYADPANGMSQIMTVMGTPAYGLVFAPVHSKLATTNLHGYLQDTWTPMKRLTLNLGLRLTHQEGRVPAQNQAEGEQTFLGVTFNRSVTRAFTPINRTSLAPRLGLTFDLTGDNKTLLKASYSRYIQANVTDYYAKANPNGFFVYAQLLMPDGNPVPNAYLFAVYPSGATVGYNGQKLKAPRSDEVTVAVERELFADWSLGARYVRKWDRDLVEDVDANQLDINALMTSGELDWTNWTQVSFTDPYDGSDKFFWNQNAILGSNIYLVNPPGAKRDYDAVEVTLEKRYTQGWSLMASYVWQNSRGVGRNLFSVYRPRVIGRHVHNLGIHRHQLDVALVVMHLLLWRTLQVAGLLSAPAHHLHCLEYVLWLVVVRIAQVGGPLQVAVHLRQHLRKRRQRFYARVPILDVGAGRNLFRGIIASRLPPAVGIRNLIRVGRRGQDLRHQPVRIERDRGDELFELHRIEWLGRRLAIFPLRVRLTGIRIRLLRVRLLSIVRLRLGLSSGRVLSVGLIVLRPSLIAGLRLLREKFPRFRQDEENNGQHEQTSELTRSFFRGARGGCGTARWTKRWTRKRGSARCMPVHLGLHFSFRRPT